MRVGDWEARYRSQERDEDFVVDPVPLVARWTARLAPGRALDLACGTGRNALWLAARGWQVTAVDGAEAAIARLRARASDCGMSVETHVADLERLEFPMLADAFDLILDSYYLQRDLFPGMRQGVRPGGVAICIVHLAWPGESLSYKHAAPGELREFFPGWDILHYYEGMPNDTAHRRPVAEVVARKPND